MAYFGRKLADLGVVCSEPTHSALRYPHSHSGESEWAVAWVHKVIVTAHGGVRGGEDVYNRTSQSSTLCSSLNWLYHRCLKHLTVRGLRLEDVPGVPLTLASVDRHGYSLATWATISHSSTTMELADSSL